MTPNEDYLKQAKLALHVSNLQALYTLQVENTKVLMAISTSAIGLLVAFMNKVDSIILAIVWGGAQFLFLINISILLSIMNLSAEYLTSMLNSDRRGSYIEEISKKKSKQSGSCFRWGIRFTVLFAGIIIYNHMTEKGFPLW